MPTDHTFDNAEAFSNHLKKLHRGRDEQVKSRKAHRPRRRSLSQSERLEILRKAGGRCHLCGGPIIGHDWQADHVLAHSTGGAHSIDNYLPAHSLCNNYRWHYDTEEFQWILKLG